MEQLSPTQAHAHLAAARSIMEECISASVDRTGSDGDAVRALLAVIDHQRAYNKSITDALKGAPAAAIQAAVKPRYGLRYIGTNNWLAYPDADTGADWPYTARDRAAAERQLEGVAPKASEFLEVAAMPDSIFEPLRDLAQAQARFNNQKDKIR